MLKMLYFLLLSSYILVVIFPTVISVVEQVRDNDGNYLWRLGTYRNRNEVPRPRGLDLEKKHKRDLDGTRPDIHNQAELKKSFIKNHFSLPLGAQIPISYSEKLKSPRGKKKSDISAAPSSGRDNFRGKNTKKSVIPVDRKPLSELLLDDDEEHGEFKPLNIRTKTRGRSIIDGSHQWGMVWKDPYPNPELQRDSQGYERSTLAGLGSFKISEEDFDSGLMGRGLGGMKERAQNENLMQGKFAEKLSDESDVEMENTNLRRSRRGVVNLPHLHHYGNHPPHLHQHVYYGYHPHYPHLHYDEVIVEDDHPPNYAFSQAKSGSGSKSSSSSSSKTSSSSSSSSSSLLNKTQNEEKAANQPIPNKASTEAISQQEQAVSQPKPNNIDSNTLANGLESVPLAPLNLPMVIPAPIVNMSAFQQIGSILHNFTDQNAAMNLQNKITNSEASQSLTNVNVAPNQNLLSNQTMINSPAATNKTVSTVESILSNNNQGDTLINKDASLLFNNQTSKPDTNQNIDNQTIKAQNEKFPKITIASDKQIAPPRSAIDVKDEKKLSSSLSNNQGLDPKDYNETIGMEDALKKHKGCKPTECQMEEKLNNCIDCFYEDLILRHLGNNSLNSSTNSNKSSSFMKVENEKNARIDKIAANLIPMVAANKTTLSNETLDMGNPRQFYPPQNGYKQKENPQKVNPKIFSGHENGDYEYSPEPGETPDFEFDKSFPFQVDGRPEQYQNHDFHHNVFKTHGHAPYKMHNPHGDYKNMHPGHPYEDKMENIVEGILSHKVKPLIVPDKNETQNQITSNKTIEGNSRNIVTNVSNSTKANESHGVAKKTGLEPNVTPEKIRKSVPSGSLRYRVTFRDALRHFLMNGGKIYGRHQEEDLSPMEVIN